MRTFSSAEEFFASVGEDIGASSWFEITQDRVQQFAEATEDLQWIHIDQDRAKDGPFGTTIAHGFLTLSLLSAFMYDVFEARNASMIVNYGLNRVRFIAPVPVGSKLRGRITLAAVEAVSGGVQATWLVTVEREGEARPVCVAESLLRIYFEDTASVTGVDG